MQTCDFDYQQFFAENDFGKPVACRSGAPDSNVDSEGVFADLPPPVWLRRRTVGDSFPCCDELLSWPVGFRAGELADLSELEMSETDPNRFVYSDGEMEAWGGIVAGVLRELDGPKLDARPLPAGARKRRATERVSGGQTMTDEFRESGVIQQSGGNPPIQRFRVGTVTVAVWSNPAPNGGFFNTVTLDRRFQQRDGGWKSTKSLRINDIPAAIAVLQRALTDLVDPLGPSRSHAGDASQASSPSDRDPEAAQRHHVARPGPREAAHW